MLKNYFKIAWRNIVKNKLYSFINVFGLCIGITCCILIGAYITDELSFDKFNANADGIARVTMEYSTGGTVGNAVTTGTKVGPQFKRTFPEVENYTRLVNWPHTISYNDKLFTEKNFIYADPYLFKIFSFSFIEGNANNALNSTDKIVLTESVAKKYFGNNKAVGKIIKANDRDFAVSGVIKDFPQNSQVQFDFAISFDNLDAAKTEQWWTANYITFILLHNKNDINKLQQKVTAYMQTNKVRKDVGSEGSDYLTYHIEPLTWVHLHSTLDGLTPNGSIVDVYILGIIALLILVIACVNYTNLAIAQFAKRSAEIGLRKVLGAVRRQLFLQFIGESLLICFIAAVIALLLSSQLFSVLNTITGRHLSLSLFFSLKIILCFLISVFIIGFAAGAYPAIILSGTIIVKILKAGFSFTSSGAALRKVLIVFQFTISAFLIIATIIILQQVNYIRNKDLGYNKEQILVLPIDNKVRSEYYPLKKQISLLPSVSSVTGGNSSPVLVEWGDAITVDNGHSKINLSINAIPADLDFIKTMNMQIVAGSDYTLSDLQQLNNNDKNTKPAYSFIFNETAVKKIGWTPQQAIGKTTDDAGKKGIIKAVVKDFNFSSLHEPVGPLMLFLDTGFIRNIFIKVSGKNIPQTIQQIGQIWKERVPYRPYDYHFLDDEYDALYKSEQRTAQLFSIFSGLAILLACLGLFGLTAFTTVQRTKEIGIRKVLGASVQGVVRLLSKDFLLLVFIAALIAFPLAWWAMNKWLEDFAYRITVSWQAFVVAGIAMLLITLLTVSFQAIKAALANPVKSLRTE